MFRSFGDRIRSRRIPVEKMIVSNAGDPAFWKSLGGPVDLIVSEDVFEHIPVEDLDVVVAEMRASLSPGGLALIRPMIYSGISGGHQLEWYSHLAGKTMQRDTEPWEHLRRDRYPANTYLNKMLRRDYRALFSKHFDILEEREKQPDLGRNQMTPEIRAELADYPDDELFSNNVMFVLKPLPAIE
ncbi:MAG: class I SAM-dependent methyltransferase [Proteobacteria bacterium]|nr:class I SAM-dependent methyltransferase [Pseudomonadota bacterium]